MKQNFIQNNGIMVEPPQIIQANIYDNPQFALDLVAHICTEKEDIEIDSFFDEYIQKRKNLYNEVSELNDKLSDNDFWYNHFIPLCNRLKHLYSDILDVVLNTSSSKLKIAVAGGYSAGKSSLLNALTEIGNKLPTDITPVSIVNTQLNCKKRNSPEEKIVIRGINLADKYVKLDEEVLSCIKHTAKNNVPLTSVLKSIILDIPSPDFLDGITFIDTPGYNNSPEKNNVSDSETARNGIKNADCIIWCIQKGRGTVPHSDLNILAEIAKEKPVFIFVTRFMNSDNSSLNVIKDVYNIATSKLQNFLGVAGVSIPNNTIEYFYPYKSNFNDVSDIIKKFLPYAKTSVDNDFVKRLEDEFDKAIKHLEQCISDCESERISRVKENDELQKNFHQTRKEKKNIEELDKMIESLIKRKSESSINLQEIISLLDGVINQGNPRVKYLRDYICGIGNYEDLDRMARKTSIFGSSKSLAKSVFDVKSDRSFVRTYAYGTSNKLVKDMLLKLLNLVDITESDFKNFKDAAHALKWAYQKECDSSKSTSVLPDDWESTIADSSENVKSVLDLSQVLSLYDEKIKSLTKRIITNDNEKEIKLKKKEVYSEISKLLSNYKQQLSYALKNAYQNAKQKVQNHLQDLKSPKEKTRENSKSDIFTAIQQDDYKAFVKCFAGDGVDMKKERCNGYSPLTYAISQGNNLMVKFFIEHGAKLDAKDSNGCNAFETAVKFHYQDICEMLLKANEELLSNTDDLEKLYNQNTFLKYIKEKNDRH